MLNAYDQAQRHNYLDAGSPRHGMLVLVLRSVGIGTISKDTFRSTVRT